MPFTYPENMDEFRTAVMGTGDKKAFVQVSTSWCGPCQGIKEDMAGLATEFEANYAFIYVDCDKCEEMQEMFEVTTMPTFLIFKGAGAPTGRYEGAKVDKIREFIENNKDA